MTGKRGYAPMDRAVTEMVASCFGAVALAVWTLLTSRAAYEVHEVISGYGLVVLQPNQLIVSSRGLAADLDEPEATIRRILKRFDDAHLIKREPLVTQGQRRTTLAHPPTRVTVIAGCTYALDSADVTHRRGADVTHRRDADATHEALRSDAEVERKSNQKKVKTTGPPDRGSALPEPFVITGEMRQWAASELPTLDVDAATREFVDYWRGVAGAKGFKRDWIATWRNSLRATCERGKFRRQPLAAVPPLPPTGLSPIGEIGRKRVIPN